MSLPRAIFLLACLTDLANSAPVPFPRAPKPGSSQSWSKPVDGLRIRLLSSRTRYRIGEPIQLVLEIQNVGKSPLTIEEPELLPRIATPGNHPYRSQSFPWAITYESPRKDRRIKWELSLMSKVIRSHRLEVGETHRIEIIGVQREKEGKKAYRKGKPRREELLFVGADSPGVYELRATFTRDTKKDKEIGKGEKAANLTSPVIKIELVK